MDPEILLEKDHTIGQMRETIEILELKIKKKQDEAEEVQRRFDEHMQSNERTERSLHERISDMQAQIELL